MLLSSITRVRLKSAGNYDNHYEQAYQCICRLKWILLKLLELLIKNMSSALIYGLLYTNTYQ